MPAIVENVIIAVLKGLRDSCACIASQRKLFSCQAYFRKLRHKYSEIRNFYKNLKTYKIPERFDVFVSKIWYCFF